MSKVAKKQRNEEPNEPKKPTPEDDARDIVELLTIANLLRAQAFRRDSSALHELASVVSKLIVETWGNVL